MLSSQICAAPLEQRRQAALQLNHTRGQRNPKPQPTQQDAQYLRARVAATGAHVLGLPDHHDVIGEALKLRMKT